MVFKVGLMSYDILGATVILKEPHEKWTVYINLHGIGTNFFPFSLSIGIFEHNNQQDLYAISLTNRIKTIYVLYKT